MLQGLYQLPGGIYARVALEGLYKLQAHYTRVALEGLYKLQGQNATVTL